MATKRKKTYEESINYYPYEEYYEPRPVAHKKAKHGDKKQSKKKKNKKKKRIILRIFLILLLLILICVAVLFWYAYDKFSKIHYDDIDESQIVVNEGVETTGYRNIVLFGVDSRKNSYENTLSDTVMIISINHDTKKVKVASVYRDTYLKIGKSYDKLTHAYMRGGPTLSLSTLNTNLDLDLKEFVAVNFNVVADVIDAIGGVEIEITAAEIKGNREHRTGINEYIDEVNKVTGHNSPHITEAGTYNLDGVQAVAYSRIRFTQGGDYKRTERQRVVLDKAFAKVKKMNIMQLNNLADVVLKEISTNIPTSQLIGLLSQVGAYEIEDTTGWPFDIRNYQPAEVWYGVPANLAEQAKQLHKFLFEKEEYVVSPSLKAISDDLIKKTGIK